MRLTEAKETDTRTILEQNAKHGYIFTVFSDDGMQGCLCFVGDSGHYVTYALSSSMSGQRGDTAEAVKAALYAAESNFRYGDVLSQINSAVKALESAVNYKLKRW